MAKDNGIKKDEAVRLSIEEMDAQQRQIQADQLREELEKRKESARPSLLKRIGAGLLDFIIALAFAGALFVVAYFAILPAAGYNKASKAIFNAYEQSGLYVQGQGSFDQLIKHYDEQKTPEENYDVPLTNFYTTNDRAISESQNEKYIQRKLNSGYYVIDENGKCVSKTGVIFAERKVFLEAEYTKAVDYLWKDPALIKASNITYMSMFLAILSCTLISVGIFYFIVPLIDKNRRTIAYMVFKLILVDSKDLEPVTSIGRTMLRAFMFVVITYISAIMLYFWAGGITYAYIPFTLNTLILAVSRSNSGLHDYGTRINVFNESRSNPFENLKAITNEGENR